MEAIDGAEPRLGILNAEGFDLMASFENSGLTEDVSARWKELESGESMEKPTGYEKLLLRLLVVIVGD